MKAEEVIIYIIELFTMYLEELDEEPRTPFTHGEMTAYVETLEILQEWEHHKEHGLDYRIEDRFKI